MDGDQDHLHHRLLRQTRKQTTAALMMYLLACLFSAVALAFLLLRDSAPAIAYMILLVAVVICVRRLAVVELYDSAELIKRGLSKPHRGVLMTMTHPFIDFLIVTCSALVSCFFMTRTLPTFQLFLFFFVPAPRPTGFTGCGPDCTTTGIWLSCWGWDRWCRFCCCTCSNSLIW